MKNLFQEVNVGVIYGFFLVLVYLFMDGVFLLVKLNYVFVLVLVW